MAILNDVNIALLGWDRSLRRIRARVATVTAKAKELIATRERARKRYISGLRRMTQRKRARYIAYRGRHAHCTQRIARQPMEASNECKMGELLDVQASGYCKNRVFRCGEGILP